MGKEKRDRSQRWESMMKDDICKAVIRVITQYGIQALTMDKVAEEAGVAKGTLYIYFKSKEQLIEYTEETTLAPLVEKLLEILDSDLPADQKLEEYVRYNLAYFDYNRNFFRILMHERQQAQSREEQYRSSRYRLFIVRIGQVIEQGINRGIFQPLDPMKLSSMFIESNIAMIAQRLIPEKPAPLEEDVNLFISVFFRGILTTDFKL